MTVTDRNLNIGDMFEAVHDGTTYRLEAVDAGEGRIAFRINARGWRRTLYGSLSAAGGAIAAPKHINGWKFWTLVERKAAPQTINSRRAA